MDRPMPHADVERGVSRVRAFRGMKNLRYKIERKLDRYNHLMELIRTLTGVTVLILQLILLLSLGSCSVSKRTEPCKQCPQYSHEEVN